MEKAINVRIGMKTYSLTSDDDYLDSISDGFEPDMVRLFQCLLQKQFCALDVGANIGCTSILFGELATRVISFEPSPTTFRFLTGNIEKSGLSNIQTHNYGLGAQSGESLLTYATNNRSGAFVSGSMKTSVGHATESIRIRTLDEVEGELNLPGIDFIKIDVEGFEKSVIAGGRDVIERFKPIVVLELNHWCLNVFQRICVPDFLDYLRTIFPVLLAIDGTSFLDLHDESESYIVMYHHINHLKYRNLLAAFHVDQLEDFHRRYVHTA